jgi:SAM-dependent methyltransferase
VKNNFIEYAPYYDYFNTGKNYTEESLYVDDLIKKFKPGAEDILDIGCGTGLHAIELAKQKYNVVGIDISKVMIDIANTKNKDPNLKLKFFSDPYQNFISNRKFDVVVSLFHVTSYQTTDDSVIKFFNSASRNLEKGGIFIFDYWFTPAVHFLKLEDRMKSIIVRGKPIQKLSKPTIISSNLFNIDINISSENHEINESHLMRSFIPEDFNNIVNFKLIESFAWLTSDDPDSTNWAAVSVLQKL